MKKLHRAVSIILAAAVLMSTTAFADKRNEKYLTLASDLNYTINVDKDTITVSSNQRSPATYTTKDGALDFFADARGPVMGFTTKGGNYNTVSFNKNMREFTVTGSMNSLALEDTINYEYTVDIDATINDFTVTGDCKVNLSDDTSINILGIHNEDAKVLQADSTAVRVTDVSPASDVRLDVSIRKFNSFTANSRYDDITNTAYLNASLEGCRLLDAVKDLVIKVNQNSNGEAVAGRWYWPALDGGKTESGTYIYRFSSEDNNHKSAEIKIVFTAKK